MEEIKNSDGNKTKKRHPIEKANILSQLFFCWLLPYFVKGFKRELNEDDMYETLRKDESKRLGDKLEAAWNYQVTQKKHPSLWMALIRVFRRELILSAFFNIFIELIIRICQPLLMARLLAFYQPNQTTVTQKDAYIYAALIVVVAFINVLSIHNYQLRVMSLGMKLRVASCSLIYRKALKLSKTALAETTIGQMVNLLSNDVGRFDFATQLVHTLWVAPIITIVVMILMYNSMGPTALVGATFLLVIMPFQVYLAKKTSTYRLRTAIRTDERVRLMSEIISGIQVIKMYTWEKPFSKLVEITRLKEMQQIRGTSVIRAIQMSCYLILNRAAIYLCILTYALTGNVVNAAYAYTLTSYYSILSQTVTALFPYASMQFAETNVSVNRIQRFLLYDELVENRGMLNTNPDIIITSKPKRGFNGILSISHEHEIGIHLKNLAVKWIHSLTENTLRNIDFVVHSNQLVAVVGTVGSGKTTLLHAILKELSPLEGSLDVRGTISYASQEPWLFGGSIRQNIIFGQEFSSKKYEEVVRVCALERDFTLFPYGDQTLVGARGVMLSGGQRARINLARAIYKEADIYLLDDPLSAVDAHVGRQLFDECICGYLKNKCVVLVTHQLQYLRDVNKIYLLEEGAVLTSGTYSELKATDNEFTKLLVQSEEEVDEKFDRQSKQMKENENEEESQDAPTQEREDRGTGKISGKVYTGYLRAGGNWFKTCVLVIVFIVSQITASGIDYFVSIWVNVEQTRTAAGLNTTINRNENISVASAADDSTTLHPIRDALLTDRTAIIIYSCLVFFTMVLTITRSISFFRFCNTASTKLHNLMFDKIVYATMRFFNTNPPGRILNRFSKDIGALDETLPLTIIDTFQIGMMVLAVTLVVGSLNPWILIPTIIILAIFYFIRVVFLATSRDIKRVEAVTRSPIYTHLSASLQGLTTIRAFGAQEILKQEFDNYQDKYTAAFFMFLGANRTFGFWLDLHCVVYIALVTISILFVESEIFGGNVGLALTQSMTLTGIFQWGMRQWSELENQMTSVERVKEYVDINPELDVKVREPPKSWPDEGNIKFGNMCLKYSPKDPYVLQNLTFEIKSKEKIGVVGRTGAGKSSLIAALFRLADIDGNISIDNLNIKEIPLSILRSKISIIPQEPVLFSGTLRKNLDPFDEYNDDILWKALDEVELKHAISELASGLDSKVSEGGSNFSVGQRQLLCLARAIIRNNKILVLDEATANVDPHTDGLIQTTIRRKFLDCTVLTIAHRLHTIMDSDKVLVMDAGRVVQFEHPHRLLQDTDGVFHKLVEQTGRGMADNLRVIAELNYKKLNI